MRNKDKVAANKNKGQHFTILPWYFMTSWKHPGAYTWLWLHVEAVSVLRGTCLTSSKRKNTFRGETLGIEHFGSSECEPACI